MNEKSLQYYIKIQQGTWNPECLYTHEKKHPKNPRTEIHRSLEIKSANKILRCARDNNFSTPDSHKREKERTPQSDSQQQFDLWHTQKARLLLLGAQHCQNCFLKFTWIAENYPVHNTDHTRLLSWIRIPNSYHEQKFRHRPLPVRDVCLYNPNETGTAFRY
jgi:hypothetical protein